MGSAFNATNFQCGLVARKQLMHVAPVKYLVAVLLPSNMVLVKVDVVKIPKNVDSKLLRVKVLAILSE